MLRYLFAFIILMHGLIHFMGFAKAFGYGNITALTKGISKPVGMLWMAAAFLFIISVLLFLFKKDWWWTGLTAALISQLLIFMFWKDAKFGTIANILALLVAIPAYADWKFNKDYYKGSNELLSKSVTAPAVIITKEMLKNMPQPVQQWLERSGIIGKEMVQKVWIKQNGEMKQGPAGNWFPFKAEQCNTINDPAFIWKVKMNPSMLMFITGRDKYESGRGNMLIKAFGLFTIADAKGHETDQGSMLRYLGEICWFPSAALSPSIQWELVDSFSAKATMSYGNITAAGIFHFNGIGDITSFEAERYYSQAKEKPRLEKWVVTNVPGAYKEFNSIRIPSRSEVTWKLKEGDFTWLRLEIKDIKYNKLK